MLPQPTASTASTGIYTANYRNLPHLLESTQQTIAIYRIYWNLHSKLSQSTASTGIYTANYRNLPHLLESTQQTIAIYRKLLQFSTHYRNIPQSTTVYPANYRKLPQSAAICLNLPKSTPHSTLFFNKVVCKKVVLS